MAPYFEILESELQDQDDDSLNKEALFARRLVLAKTMTLEEEVARSLASTLTMAC